MTDKTIALEAAGVTLARAKAFLVAGKTPTEVYALYVDKFAGLPAIGDELLAELKLEVKAVIGLAWPEVRQQALAAWAAERRAAAVGQKVVLSAETLAEHMRRIQQRNGGAT